MTASSLIDTHCHISEYPDPVSVIRAAETTNISIVAVTEDPDGYRRLRTRLGRRSNVEVALGLHPLRAASFTPNHLARFFRLVPECRWIGEVGLDFSQVGLSTKRQQLSVFDVVLTAAQPGRHPLTVHSRGAEKEVIGRLVDAKLPAILHWYTGPLGPINDALAAGLYFSINAAMTRSKKFRSLMSVIPCDRILLETDGPYAKSGGQPTRPHKLGEVTNSLATIWNVTPDAATAMILKNQNSLLELVR